MAKRARVRVVAAAAERLPFPAESFDTVVSTLVLCSVADLEAAIAEIRRVLRPTGRLLFLEHVRAPAGTRLARWQDRLNPAWRRVAGGCNCNRSTIDALRAGGFVVDVAPVAFRPPLVRPVLAGSGRVAPVS
jgi:ubiquinone/menaquinone biosynthesis C-methylase UbiE